MDICPLDGACFSVGVNVVFMFNGREETPFQPLCQSVFWRGEKCVVGFARGVKLI
jgi:hypothetical protein